jgi:Helicase conserved C-terminal domain
MADSRHYEERLQEHLKNAVIGGITGRDGAILPERPYRQIFAGVLQSPRQGSPAGGSASPGRASAIGMDFRLRPHEKHVSFRCTISFAIYCPTFPDVESARQQLASQHVTFVEPDPAIDENDESDDLSLDDGESLDDSGSDDDTADEAEGTDTAEPILRNTATPETVTISPVYRRHEVCIPDVEVSHYSGSSNADARIAEALLNLRATLAASTESWSVKGGGGAIDLPYAALTSQKSYEPALAAQRAGQPVLPEWQAVMELTSARDVEDQELEQFRILLVNKTPSIGSHSLIDGTMYDARFTLEILNADIVPLRFHLAPKDYRSDPRILGRGINCVPTDPGNTGRTLYTETVPTFRQPLFRALDDLPLTFSVLKSEQGLRVLEDMRLRMNGFLLQWDSYLNEENALEPEGIEACRQDQNRFQRELRAFDLGLECLSQDTRLAQAFRYMNRAFEVLSERSGGRIKSWRPFQVGFIVSQLSAIAARESESMNENLTQRVQEEHKNAGVLWFPTGGGKTEAYLGLIATALVHDRLRGKLRGVNTWMRFPLRMLSLQQLERMARVIAILNELRAEYPELGSGDPFTLGYFIGKGSSPNRLSATDVVDLSKDARRRNRYRYLRKCPHCSSPVTVEVAQHTLRLLHVCSNPACFSNTSETLQPYFKGCLPVAIVDKEIYRFLPTVLLGTIDKLAAVVLERDFASLVVGADRRCAEHGYCAYGACMQYGCTVAKRSYVKAEPSKDPAPTFLVQDEFHLLKDELGVFDGHYEGALQVLFRQSGLPPKVLAATATIEAYKKQAYEIYLKDASRFPESGWRRGESFYATSSPLIERRVYVGVLGHTKALEEPVLRIQALYLAEVRRLRRDPKALAAVLGMPESDSLVGQRLLRLYDLVLTYVHRKVTGGAINDSRRVIDQYLERQQLGTITSIFLSADQTSDEIGATIERIEAEIDDTGEPRLDSVIATNLISHGVDLERINMMCVCGMPSHYAEYVQSSSRCARSHAGLVFTCFKSTDPREASQYQTFSAFHQHMDRLIEPVAVNRFASFAPNKTIPGIVTSMLLDYFSPKLFSEGRLAKPLDDVRSLQISLGYQPANSGTQSGTIDKDKLRELIRESIGVGVESTPALEYEVARLRNIVDACTDEALGRIGRSLENRLRDTLDCLVSFRDVDRAVAFASMDSSELLSKIAGNR